MYIVYNTSSNNINRYRYLIKSNLKQIYTLSFIPFLSLNKMQNIDASEKIFEKI